jgi:hypothetical protein
MKLSFEQPASLEQRAARKAAIDGMSRALLELWKDEPAAPVPERFLRLLARLEQAQKKPGAQSQLTCMITRCARCDDTFWVREAHSDVPSDGGPHRISLNRRV